MGHPVEEAICRSFLADLDRQGCAILEVVGATFSHSTRAKLPGASGRYTLRGLLGAAAELRTAAPVLSE